MIDYYLKRKNFYKRLEKEYKKYGMLIIAYDFDDTVYDFHKQGRTYNKIIKLLREWKGFAYFIVYTASDETRYPDIKRYLKENDIPFHTINENIDTLNVPHGKKLYYNVLLDDRAGLNTAYWALKKLIRQVGD